MKVYRVENPGLVGPYSAGYEETTLAMRRDHNNGPMELHPSPAVSMHVSMMSEPTSYKCAFNSMQALFKWFGGWLPGLIREGFHVSVVEGVVIQHGPDNVGQVIFDDWRNNTP